MTRGLLRMLAAAYVVVGMTALRGVVSGAEHPGPMQEASAKGNDAPPAEKEAKPMMGTTPSVTTATLTPAGGKQMEYTATTGYMPLNDEQGKLRANVFYVSYFSGAASPETQPATRPGEEKNKPFFGDSHRPITFLFNGGPGAASVWLHLGAVGPRRIDIPADGTAPTAPYKVVENPYSWLPATDLVFVDPVNTGYSRPATQEQAKEFLGVKEDISAMGEFIRLFLTKNERWGSPVFLAGESYGTTRAAALSNYLQERAGVSVSGVVLISTVLNFSTLNPGDNNDLPFALYLPSYSAVAWYHKKLDMAKHADLDALLKESEQFAENEYATALMKGQTLSVEERKSVAAKLSDLTGLSVPYILESRLRISPWRFEKELLRSPGGEGDLVVGRFDGRIAGPPTDAQNDSQEYDPSLSGFLDAYTSAFNVYVRKTLRYDNDIAYEVLSNRVYPWNWKSGTGDENGYLYVGDSLRDAMTHNPHLRLMVCSGHFDLATPFFATDYQIDHLGLAPELRKNITQKYYPGGHMIYHVQQGLEQLSADAKTFIEGK
ncbi:MAG TPA: peptidase S10 [Phycisphaerae bacterium]|nr:peptidase S10 [Phycisphaerae bacterium]